MKQLISSSDLTFTKEGCGCGMIKNSKKISNIVSSRTKS